MHGTLRTHIIIFADVESAWRRELNAIGLEVSACL